MIQMGENVLPIFKSFAQLQEEQDQLLRKFAEDWESAFQKLDAVQAVLRGDDDTLAKLDGTDVAMAKSHVECHGKNAELEAMSALVETLKKLANKRNEAIFGIGRLAKRSERFASAVSRRYSGVSSDVLPMAGRRQ